MNKFLLIITLAFFGFEVSAQKSANFPMTNDDCRIRGGITFGYNKIQPLYQAYNLAGIENFNSFSMDASFMKYYFGSFNVQHHVGFSMGTRLRDNLIKDIAFEGGYTGGFSAQTTRTSGYAYSSFGYQPFKIVEVSIFGGFALRGVKRTGDYFLYPGQVIASEDLVSEDEADDANSYKLGGALNFGFKTGAELVLFPNKKASFFTRINYNYFGKAEVFDVAETRINSTSGEPYSPSSMVVNSSDWGITLGLRFNLWRDCVKTRSCNSSSSKSNNHNSNSSRSNNNNNTSFPSNGGSGGSVKLKPKVRTPIKN